MPITLTQTGGLGPLDPADPLRKQAETIGVLDPDQVYVMLICQTGPGEHNADGVPDDRVRPSHAALHGTVWRLDDPRAPIPPLDYGCFLPGTRISGVIDGASRALYHGKAVEILTKNGARLSVTPNHPIPTEYGLVPAGTIQPGWHVLIDPAQVQGVPGEHPDEHDQPPTVEEVFDLSAQFWPVGRARVGPTDFHGDGQFIDGQVDVVGSYDLLRRVRDAYVLENGGDGRLGLGHELRPLPHGRLGDHGASGRLDPAELDGGSLVRSSGLSRALDRIHQRPLQLLGLRLVAELDASGQQAQGDHATGDAECFGERIDGRPLLVARDQAGNIDWRQMRCLHLGAGPSGHASLLEPGVDRIALDPELEAEFFGTGPGLVEPDEVVEVRVFEYSGHVYDVRSPVGHVIANGATASNCRCSLVHCAAPGTAAAKVLPDVAPSPPVTSPAVPFRDWLDEHAPAWKQVQSAMASGDPAEATARGYQKARDLKIDDPREVVRMVNQVMRDPPEPVVPGATAPVPPAPTAPAPLPGIGAKAEHAAEAIQRMKDLPVTRDAAGQLTAESRAAAREILALPQAERTAASVTVAPSRRTAGITEGIDQFRAMVSTKVMPADRKLAVVPTRSRRAFARPWLDEVHLSAMQSPRVTAHELGHLLEKDPAIKAAARAFWERRTAGESSVSLRTLTGIKAYRSDEIARRDKFINPYMGKDYGPGNYTEIVSMGLELYVDDPVAFAAADPDYFRFIFLLVRGTLEP